jgi:hydroxypyruvate isomerase
MRRRDFVAIAAAGFAGTSAADAQSPAAVSRKGRLKQCAMRVNFDPKMPFDDMCREAARLGCKGFDLIGPQDWPTLRKYGLISTMAPAGSVTIRDGMLRKELHDDMEKPMHAWIDQCAANGCPNIITVGGQRRGMSL